MPGAQPAGTKTTTFGGPKLTGTPEAALCSSRQPGSSSTAPKALLELCLNLQRVRDGPNCLSTVF